MAQLLKNWQGFKPIRRGDEVRGTVVAVLPDKIIIDFGGKSEGEILTKEFENLKNSGMLPAIGEQITAIVVNPEDETGTTFLSIGSKLSETAWNKVEKIATEGNTIEAEIKGLAKSGILVETAGLRGFIPASFASPEILANFDKFRNKKIQVKLLEVNKSANRLVCATAYIKPTKTALEELLKKYKKGTKYTGQVLATLSFGVVVNFQDLSAFVPNSELAWEKVEDAVNFSKVGQNVEFIFTGIDKTSGNPQISPKLATPDPLEKIAVNYPKDAEIYGTVSKLADFGVFVTLAGGVEGLIHISKIPPDKTFTVGEPVTCTIDSIDTAQRRVSLSLVLKAKPVGYR